jgi:hypothetical protein
MGESFPDGGSAVLCVVSDRDHRGAFLVDAKALGQSLQPFMKNVE